MNQSSGNSSAVASPSTISTPGEPANRFLSSSTNSGSTSTAVRRRRQLAQHVRGRSVTGADLEDFVAEILVAQGPGQDLLANVEPPFIAAAHLVVLVHPFSMSPSPCPPGQRSIRLGRHLWFDNQSCWADQGLTAGALPCFAQRTVSRSSSARRAALRRTCRPGAPGTLSQAGRGWPGATVRARMPRVALSACSEMTGKIPESFHCCSTDDQSQ